jgi:hypothetical protein
MKHVIIDFSCLYVLIGNEKIDSTNKSPEDFATLP